LLQLEKSKILLDPFLLTLFDFLSDLGLHDLVFLLEILSLQIADFLVYFHVARRYSDRLYFESRSTVFILLHHVERNLLGVWNGRQAIDKVLEVVCYGQHETWAYQEATSVDGH
jgi:hypothetical protein